MDKISILEFRRHAEEIIRQVARGKRLLLTYRGKPVIRLEPIEEGKVSSSDPFYSICDLASFRGKSLSNEEIDQSIYKQ